MSAADEAVMVGVDPPEEAPMPENEPQRDVLPIPDRPYSADETCDVGSDTASPVSDDYTTEGSRFSGTVNWVQIDTADAAEDLDHLISSEERLKIAMAKQ